MSDLVVFAKNKTEMVASQHQLIEWALQKLGDANQQLADVEENIEHARTRKWKLSGWQNQQRIAKKKVEYYEKIHAALEAGYVIVPNFPIDIFAIRTERATPLRQTNTGDFSWSDNIDRTQHSDVLQIGAGEYVDSEPVVLSRSISASGKTQYRRWADAFKDVDFPVKAVKPVILDETGKALLLKVFDEIGCNPGRKGWSAGQSAGRGADPMVIGRIMYKRGGYSEPKSVSFLIAWWLKAEDIAV